MITYRRLLAAEAEQLVMLVKQCYSDSYPMSLFYDVEALRHKLADGSLISAVAENAAGQLIGHVGTMWEYPGCLTADAMTGMILEQYQRQGILAQLTRTLGTLYSLADLAGLQLYSVTTHTASQRNGLDRGTIECGFLIPEFPATMNAQGVVNDPLGQRNPALVMYCPILSAPPRDCFIPADYASMVDSIYRRANYSRHIQTAIPEASIDPLPHHSDGVEFRDSRKGVDRLCLHQIGLDWLDYSAEFLQRVMAQPSTKGGYLDIPVSQARAIEVINYLRSEGWCFGCIVFERRDGDYLRMQYSQAHIHRGALQIASEFGEQLVDFVFSERGLIE